jgi:hypothetical protein
MGRAKDIVVKPISGTDANRIVKALHYSGKVVPNSQVHLGVFLDGRCGGAIQLGPSMRQDLSARLVHGTKPREFIELNRMALADWLPRNGESRVLSVMVRLLKKNYPHLKWLLTFADGTQCGDGTIYRAAGFILTQIKENQGMRRNPKTGEIMQAMQAYHLCIDQEFRSEWEPLPGFQLRYVKFLHEHERKNLAVPEIPYERIKEIGAAMYKGQRSSEEDGKLDHASEA